MQVCGLLVRLILMLLPTNDPPPGQRDDSELVQATSLALLARVVKVRRGVTHARRALGGGAVASTPANPSRPCLTRPWRLSCALLSPASHAALLWSAWCASNPWSGVAAGLPVQVWPQANVKAMYLERVLPNAMAQAASQVRACCCCRRCRAIIPHTFYRCRHAPPAVQAACVRVCAQAQAPPPGQMGDSVVQAPPLLHNGLALIKLLLDTGNVHMLRAAHTQVCFSCWRRPLGQLRAFGNDRRTRG